jgi:two-component system, NtrC family, sensor kinase
MKQNHYTTMKRMILIAMILVPFIPFILVLGIGYYYFTSSTEANAIASVKRIAEDHRQMIDSFLMERKSNIELILHSYTYAELSDPARLHVVFENLQRASNAFMDLGVFNQSGIHVAYEGPFKLTGKSYGYAHWFQKVMEDGHYISDVFLGYRGIPHFIIALKKEEENMTWVLRATIDTQLFNDLVRRVRIGRTGEAYLINSEGIFQTERRSGGGLMEKDPDFNEFVSSQTNVRTFRRGDTKRAKYLYAVTPLTGKDWVLFVRQEENDAFRAVHSAAYLIVLITILGGSGIVGVAFHATNRIVRRMENLDTEKDRLGEQLIRATRLAELGGMAAGFAHEINNPLQIMKSEQALMEAVLSDLKKRGDLKESEDLTELEESMHQIDLQIERCSNITQAILKFGRKGKPIFENLDLKVFIPEVTRMVEKRAEVHGIQLKEKISQDVPLIHGDPGQLQQVLINLLNNAIDAILDRHGSQGGELEVTASSDQNGKVDICVRDNGSGIGPENLKRIFTPFFTTKPVGKGTGLGLSVCYGIVDNMGGVMEVKSEKGTGSTFSIHLPAAS